MEISSLAFFGSSVYSSFSSHLVLLSLLVKFCPSFTLKIQYGLVQNGANKAYCAAMLIFNLNLTVSSLVGTCDVTNMSHKAKPTHFKIGKFAFFIIIYDQLLIQFFLKRISGVKNQLLSFYCFVVLKIYILISYCELKIVQFVYQEPKNCRPAFLL